MSLAVDIATPLIAGGLAFGGSMYAAKRELNKLHAERFNQREQDFEKAQGGYRACYRKFLVNAAAFHAQTRNKKDGDQKEDQGGDEKGQKVTLATLLDNAWEATFVGDPRVVRELENYWPIEDREKRQPPQEKPMKELVDAMLAHGGRSLKGHLALIEQTEKEVQETVGN